MTQDKQESVEQIAEGLSQQLYMARDEFSQADNRRLLAKALQSERSKADALREELEGLVIVTKAERDRAEKERDALREENERLRLDYESERKSCELAVGHWNRLEKELSTLKAENERLKAQDEYIQLQYPTRERMRQEIARLSEELSTTKVSLEVCRVALESVRNIRELNPNNYNPDDLALLQSDVLEAYQLAGQALSTTQPTTNELAEVKAQLALAHKALETINGWCYGDESLNDIRNLSRKTIKASTTQPLNSLWRLVEACEKWRREDIDSQGLEDALHTVLAEVKKEFGLS